MRQSIAQLTAMVLIQVIFLRSAVACEAHNIKEKSSQVLSGGSIYNLNSGWINEGNSKIQLSDLPGRSRLVAMVYTKCQTACPLLIQNIKGILKNVPAEKRQKIHIDLFSFDFSNENAKTLTDFKTKHRLDNQWSVYAGSKKAVSELAAVLGIQYKALLSGEFIHSNAVFLLNEDGEIIAKHEGLGRDTEGLIAKLANSN